MSELGLFLFAGSLITICTESFMLIKGSETDLNRDHFAIWVMAFFLFYCILEYIFRLFVSSKASSLFSLLPAFILFYAVKDVETFPYLEAAVVVAALLRLLFVLLPGRDVVITWGSFVLGALSAYLCFGKGSFTGENITDKLLFAFLAALILAAFQKIIYEKNRGSFPFYFFVVIALIVSVIPMGQKPIDWTVVLDAGERIAGRFSDMVDSASYYLGNLFGDSGYSTGYNSLKVTGDKTSNADKTQLILEMVDKPYIVYKDEEKDVYMKMRRSVHLAGGRGVDIENLCRFFRFMYDNELDKETAGLFAKTADLNITYVYLDTKDEIAPTGAYEINAGGKRVEGGVSDIKHKKGYSISTRYLDVDYGSNYLIPYLREKEDTAHKEGFTFDEARKCAWEFGIGLDKYMTAEEFDAIFGAEKDNSESLDTTGASSQMKELALKLTQDADNNFDKCKIIEGYLRQYTYSTNAVGGHNPQSDMSTTEGMADIADRFLFESGSGYCVHYTSAMVMLLRLSGIPARAVTGYSYAFPFDAQDNYLVSSNCAHVWPEAYFEELGWVPFEPTSSYNTAEEYTWHTKAKTEKTGEPGTSAAGMPTNVGITYPELEGPLAEDAPKQTSAVATKVFKIAWPVILSVVGILILLIVGTAAAGKIRYLLGSPSKRLAMDVEMIKKNIRKKGDDSFTDRGLLSDYVERAPQQSREDLKKVFDSYYRMVYAENGRDISAKESSFAKTVREQIVSMSSRNAASSNN